MRMEGRVEKEWRKLLGNPLSLSDPGTESHRAGSQEVVYDLPFEREREREVEVEVEIEIEIVIEIQKEIEKEIQIQIKIQIHI